MFLQTIPVAFQYPVTLYLSQLQWLSGLVVHIHFTLSFLFPVTTQINMGIISRFGSTNSYWWKNSLWPQQNHLLKLKLLEIEKFKALGFITPSSKAKLLPPASTWLPLWTVEYRGFPDSFVHKRSCSDAFPGIWQCFTPHITFWLWWSPQKHSSFQLPVALDVRQLNWWM